MCWQDNHGWVAAALAAALTFAAPAAARDVAIHAGRLIDGTGAEPRSTVTILVHDDRITAVQQGFTSPAGAEVVDLSDATVLPGLIDAHVHITAQQGSVSPIIKRFTTNSYDTAFASTVYARRTLEAGFTSVRDVAADTEIVVALKRAIQDGVVAGPRMWVSGYPLGPTGGHSDPRNGIDSELEHPGWDARVVDGPEEAIKAVRALHRAGADLIKIMPSGGVTSIGDDPRQTLMRSDEIAAIVATAHALGMKVAAHAHGKDAVDLATRLGVDSIEHGTFADAESFALMKQHGTYYVPTLLVAKTAMDFARAHPERLNPSSVAKTLAVAPSTIRNLGAAYRAGVKIAFGTDMVLAPHGTNAKEFALMVEAGMTPRDAILAATRGAADLLGASADIGSIQAGRYADIIAVRGDPLADVTLLEHVAFVMKGGVTVRGADKP